MNPKINLLKNRQTRGPIHPAEIVAGAKVWGQIEVSGEHPTNDGRVLVIDAEARTNIIDSFQREAEHPTFAGMLVDADHLSHDLDQQTHAYAWLHHIEERDGQLWGELELTGRGAPAIANKDYKFFSSEYDAEDQQDLGGGRVRPLRLSGLAFTNRPKIRGGQPITNRNRTQPPTEEPETEKPNSMKTIATHLQVEESEDAILNRIKEIQQENADLKAANTEAEADAILNRYADRLPLPDNQEQAEAVRASWRSNLIANREATEAILQALPEPKPADKVEDTKPAPRQPLTNRDTAATPDTTPSGETDGKADAAKAARISNRAAQLRKDGVARNLPESYRIAEAQIDEEEAAKA